MISKAHSEPSCASFSSEVVDALGDRQRRIAVARLGAGGGDAVGDGHPFTAPEVRPLMSWRSAKA
jgi:hypothetical protein